jgi:hypothetical protein
MSELTTSDLEILMKSNGKWGRTKLVSGERLYLRSSYNLKVEDSVVIIDVTEKPWVKQLGSVLLDGSVQFGHTTDVVRRHFVHIRCKNHITIVNGSKYCDKCKRIVVPANICYLSCLSKELLKNKNFILGDMLVDNVGNKVILIDMERVIREKDAV